MSSSVLFPPSVLCSLAACRALCCQRFCALSTLRKSAELENNNIEDYLDNIDPLYHRSLSPKYHQIAGLDDYLTEKFVAQTPSSLPAALSQLRMAWNISSDLSHANAQPSQCAKVQVCVLLPQTCAIPNCMTTGLTCPLTRALALPCLCLRGHFHCCAWTE